MTGIWSCTAFPVKATDKVSKQEVLNVENERAMVFIDGGNLYAGVKFGLHLQKSVDIDSLIKKLTLGRRLVRAYYYTTRVPIPTPYRARDTSDFSISWDGLKTSSFGVEELYRGHIQLNAPSAGEHSSTVIIRRKVWIPALQ